MEFAKKDNENSLSLEDDEFSLENICENEKKILIKPFEYYEKYKYNLFFEQKEVNKKIANIYYTFYLEKYKDTNVFLFIQKYILIDVIVAEVKGIPGKCFYQNNLLEIIFQHKNNNCNHYYIKYLYIDDYPEKDENIIIHHNGIEINLEKNKINKSILQQMCKYIFRNCSKLV